MAHKTHKAFYGARGEDERTRDDAARRNTVKAHVSPGERPQDILTPPTVLEPLREVWGGIMFDPYPNSESLVGALMAALDGNAVAWPDRAFANPPYRDLKKVLNHALKQPGRWLALVPHRTNRKWYRHALTQVDGFCCMNPLKFLHYKQAFPDRLAMLYRGPDVREVAAAMSHLGDWQGPVEVWT